MHRRGSREQKRQQTSEDASSMDEISPSVTFHIPIGPVFGPTR